MRPFPSPSTPLFGREPELAMAQRLLERDGNRLLTLTGPGGVGKTRLALAIAETVEAACRTGGAVFVDLSSIDDASLVEERIADALGVVETTARPLHEAIAVALGGVGLLVLDNCEHVLGAAANIARLLETSPHVMVLATSREAWHLRGEHELPVPPLPVPDHACTDAPATAATNAAVKLFAARAQALDPGFIITEKNVAAVIELVRRLDGMPLALELAAARIKLLPPAALLRRIEHRLDLLETHAFDMPRRHRTLRSAIAWSVDLLSETEALLFRRLAAFSGGWTIEAAQAVCGSDDLDVLHTLGLLLDKSLIYRDASEQSEPRFGMLQTLRSYALEQLEAHAELERIRRRHAAHCVEWAEQLQPGLLASPDEVMVGAVAADHANVHAALQWSIDSGDSTTGLRLGAALWPYWFGRGHLIEGRRLLEQVLDGDATGRVTLLRARALAGLAALMLRQEDLVAGQARAEEALQAAQANDDRHVAALALFELGWIARVTGNTRLAQQLLDQSCAAAKAAGDQFWHATSVEHLGIIALHGGELDKGLTLLESSVSLHRRAGHTWGLAGGLLALGALKTAQGAFDSAQSALSESVNVYRALGDSLGVANCLDALGTLWVARSTPVVAARLFGAAEAARERVGVSASWSLEPTREAALDTIRATLGQPVFDQAWNAGRGLAIADVIAVAFADPTHETVSAKSSLSESALITARERQVAALIPLGLSNRQIAERLVIGERTVESHVSHLMAKLHLPSRTRLASWATEASLEVTASPVLVRTAAPTEQSVHEPALARIPRDRPGRSLTLVEGLAAGVHRART